MCPQKRDQWQPSTVAMQAGWLVTLGYSVVAGVETLAHAQEALQ